MPKVTAFPQISHFAMFCTSFKPTGFISHKKHFNRYTDKNQGLFKNISDFFEKMLDYFKTVLYTSKMHKMGTIAYFSWNFIWIIADKLPKIKRENKKIIFRKILTANDR